jgi:tRNA pseudouridine38-40 synthase
VRLLLTVQYLGTRYAGWQSQINATAIQDLVEAALANVFGAPIRIEGAGRTDAGVHALAQRAHCDVPFEIPARGLIHGINNQLPHDIRIVAAEHVADDFHCRFAAKSKTYAYRIWNAEVADVFAYETHLHVAQPLDVDAMHAAAQALAGTHDFRSYTVAEPEVSSTVRTIGAIGVERAGADAVHLTVSADGFLRYMVRRIAGSLVEVGRGRIDAAALARTVEPGFEPARHTAAAKGLVLLDIRY